MPRLDQSLIEDLTCHLREKPGLVERRERNESWMTAAEIANWIKDTRGIEHRSEEIEEELLAWWRADPHSRLIRPAKYPAENTIARLWGHVDRIGRLPESELQTFRTDPPIDLEALSLPPDAPVCFLSYAAPDLHFAARVRVFLSHHGFDTWIYSREISEGQDIFEAVRAAIERADCFIALATPQSLASAWMWTELTYNSTKPYRKTVVFDGNDSKLTALLASWRPPLTGNDRAFVDLKKLPEMKEAYARFNSDVRVTKYEDSAENFLFAMGSFNPSIYPRRPRSVVLHPSISDFEAAILTLKEEIELRL